MDDLRNWVLNRTILSNRGAAYEVFCELEVQMKAHNWSAEEITHVHIACEEAMVNAIVHGNENNEGASIDVCMSCDGRSVRVEITDQGKGFDVAKVPDPRQGEFRETPGGRGLLMMRELMCEVIHSQRGNQVTLVKRRDAESGQ